MVSPGTVHPERLWDLHAQKPTKLKETCPEELDLSLNMALLQAGFGLDDLLITLQYNLLFDSVTS